MLEYYNPLYWMGFYNQKEDEEVKIKDSDLSLLSTEPNSPSNQIQLVTKPPAGLLNTSLQVDSDYPICLVIFTLLTLALFLGYCYFLQRNKSQQRVMSRVKSENVNERGKRSHVIYSESLPLDTSFCKFFQSKDSILSQPVIDHGGGESTTIVENLEFPQFITLHQFPRGKYAPMGIRELRLESVLRILRIPHHILLDANKNTGIWISYGYNEIAIGYNECMDYIEKFFTNTSAQDWDISIEHTVPGRFALSLLKGELSGYMAMYQFQIWKRRNINLKKDLKKYDSSIDLELIALKQKEDILYEIEKCLNCLNASLGDQEFLIGNQLTVADGFAFAVLAQMIWENDAGLQGILQKYPNLMTYGKNIQTLIWSDWFPPIVNVGESGRAVSMDVIYQHQPQCRSEGYVNNAQQSTLRKRRSIRTFVWETGV